MSAYDLLSYTIIKGIWKELTDQRDVSTDYRWTGSTDGKLGNVLPSSSPRIPEMNTTIGEINARISDRVVIAPIIQTGAKAPLRTPNPTVRLEQTTVCKIKHGMPIDEDMIRVLERLNDNFTGLEDMSGNESAMTFVNYEANQLSNLVEGIKIRKEHMAIGMLTDTYTYSNNGVIFTMAFNQPAETKVTPSQMWSNDGLPGISHGNANATPLSDIWNLQETLLQKYGVMFNRLSMPFQCFQWILNTTEFKAFAPLYFTMFGIAPNVTTLPQLNKTTMKALLEAMFGGNMIIEFDDRTFMVEQDDLVNWAAPPNAPAANQQQFYHPRNKVILSYTGWDNQRQVWDIAKTPVTEAMVKIPAMIGSGPSGNRAMTYGPFSYATAASMNADPPGIDLWAVENATPRKKYPITNAVLTVA